MLLGVNLEIGVYLKLISKASALQLLFFFFVKITGNIDRGETAICIYLLSFRILEFMGFPPGLRVSCCYHELVEKPFSL